MSALTTKKRNALKDTSFGLPEQRKYPINNSKSHAVNAKARATQMVKKGKLSKSSKEKIDTKANKVLGKKPVKKKEGDSMSHVSEKRIKKYADSKNRK